MPVLIGVLLSLSVQQPALPPSFLLSTFPFPRTMAPSPIIWAFGDTKQGKEWEEGGLERQEKRGGLGPEAAWLRSTRQAQVEEVGGEEQKRDFT